MGQIYKILQTIANSESEGIPMYTMVTSHFHLHGEHAIPGSCRKKRWLNAQRTRPLRRSTGWTVGSWTVTWWRFAWPTTTPPGLGLGRTAVDDGHQVLLWLFCGFLWLLWISIGFLLISIGFLLISMGGSILGLVDGIFCSNLTWFNASDSYLNMEYVGTCRNIGDGCGFRWFKADLGQVYNSYGPMVEKCWKCLQWHYNPLDIYNPKRLIVDLCWSMLIYVDLCWSMLIWLAAEKRLLPVKVGVIDHQAVKQSWYPRKSSIDLGWSQECSTAHSTCGWRNQSLRQRVTSSHLAKCEHCLGN